MNRAIISQRITSILAEIERLNNALYAMNTTDIQRYSIFKQASEGVRGGVIIGLGSRLQVFQNRDIRNITSYNEIDLELPGKQPCAYYCITSDQDSTFDFLSSLFLSFVFIRLVRYADEHCPGGELPVPVHVLGEELCACGVIPDLSRKISVIRSRNLSMSCVFQNLAGLQNRYPYNQWQEILGNCDVQLFLGCTDALTAEFISDRTGEASISVTSKAKQLGTWRVSNYTPEYRETSGVGRRKLMTMDEVLRMDIDKALILIRGKNVLEVDKYDYRIAIPLKEMMLYSGPVPYGAKYKPFMERMNSILATMLTAEIDFIVRGLDNTARSVVASRKAAMLRKRQTFYLDTNEDGVPMIYEGRVVQARVIGVAEKVLRVEVFGVECTIFARDLSAAWFGDAREYYSVGDRVLVRVLTIDRDDINHISITADIRSVSSAANQSNLDKCVLQGKYAGRVTDVRHGVVFIRLNNGVNAVAHTCYDRRMPGKKDDVSFAVTRLDEERGIAVGIITRIIKQNL